MKPLHAAAAVRAMAALCLAAGLVPASWAQSRGELLYAKNFYVALLSIDGEYVEFPYAADEIETKTLTRRKRARGLSEYVIETGRPLLAMREGIQALEAQGLVRSIGPLAWCWLGVPLTRVGLIRTSQARLLTASTVPVRSLIKPRGANKTSLFVCW